MSEEEAFRDARAAFQNMRPPFRNLLQQRPQGWQRSYVLLRRTLQERLAEVGTTGCRLLTLRGDVSMLRKFENAHANFRRVLTLHQMACPVVSVDPSDPDYLSSTDRAADAYLAFTRTMDEVFGPCGAERSLSWQIQRPASA